MTLPESNPATTLSLASTGGAVPRNESLGTGSSRTHCYLPVCASSACTRPSTVRTITRSPATSGAASTSLLSACFHSELAGGRVERDDLAVAGADRDQIAADAGTGGEFGLGVFCPAGAARRRVERYDVAIARRRVQRAVG